MHDILKRWYEGNLFPCEEINPDNTEYRDIFQRIEKDFFQLLAFLPPEQQMQLKKMSEDMRLLSSFDQYANFSYGFRLGASLMCELFLS